MDGKRGNGHDKDADGQDGRGAQGVQGSGSAPEEGERVVSFPKSLKDRDRLRRQREQGSQQAGAQGQTPHRQAQSSSSSLSSGRTPSEPILRLPPFTRALIIIMLVVHLWQVLLPEATRIETLLALGFTPARFTGGLNLGWQGPVSILTHMFLHGGWLHLGINLGMLMAFGAGLEKFLGARRTAAFFMATALLGAVAHLVFYPDGMGPLVGASGGISGLFAGSILMLQRQGRMERGLRQLMPIIVVWVGLSLFFGLFGAPGDGGANIAWVVHLAGFFAGLALFRRFLPPGV